MNIIDETVDWRACGCARGDGLYWRQPGKEYYKGDCSDTDWFQQEESSSSDDCTCEFEDSVPPVCEEGTVPDIWTASDLPVPDEGLMKVWKKAAGEFSLFKKSSR